MKVMHVLLTSSGPSSRGDLSNMYPSAVATFVFDHVCSTVASATVTSKLKLLAKYGNMACAVIAPHNL